MPAAATPKRATPAKSGPERSTTIPGMTGIEISPDRIRRALARLQRDVRTGGRHLVRDLGSTRNAIRRDLRSLGRGLTPHRVNHK